MNIQEHVQQVQPGFYYHYKHNPDQDLYNYAYEVLGVGVHTEINGEEGLMVIYRPLYESFVYKNKLMADVRPLSMFVESVNKDTYQGERFRKITDLEIIEKLEERKKKMYE